MGHTNFAIAFKNGAKLQSEVDRRIVVKTKVIGQLKVFSGRISVADPLTHHFDEAAPPLDREVPKGKFPVEIAIADLNGDERVACARVRFVQDRLAVRWEPANFADEELKDGEISGYGVDAGTGSFFDAALCSEEFDEDTSEDWFCGLDDNDGYWYVAPLKEGNIAMFASGWGDGWYNSYWGFDAEGELVELATDFDVLDDAVPVAGIARYELVEGNSSKFWEIELQGDSFTTSYGRIGSAGQSTSKSFESEEKAKAEYDKLVAEKVKKGYKRVEG